MKSAKSIGASKFNAEVRAINIRSEASIGVGHWFSVRRFLLLALDADLFYYIISLWERELKRKDRKMSRKDFVLIAETIRNLPVNDKTRLVIAMHFAGNLKWSNPNFDAAQFVNAATEKEKMGAK